MPKTTKKQNQKKHAKRRAKERFDLKLNAKQMAVVNSLAKRTIPARKQSRRVSIRYITYRGKLMKIAYDRNRKQVITIMKP